MSKKIFDIFMIIAILGFCLLFYKLDHQSHVAGFLFLPILAIYFIGQYVERKFGKPAGSDQTL